MFLDQMFDQQRNIFGPFAKRRDMDLHNVKPIVKILPKPACFNFFFKFLLVAANTRTSICRWSCCR